MPLNLGCHEFSYKDRGEWTSIIKLLEDNKKNLKFRWLLWVVKHVISASYWIKGKTWNTWAGYLSSALWIGIIGNCYTCISTFKQPKLVSSYLLSNSLIEWVSSLEKTVASAFHKKCISSIMYNPASKSFDYRQARLLLFSNKLTICST